jgi:cytochrome c
MRLARWTSLIAMLLGLGLGAGALTLQAQDDEAEKARVAAEALAKVVEQGKELFHSKKIGRKSCASCHEDPDKPQLSLVDREWGYPAYSRRARGVITLSQKVNEMIKFQARGAKDLALDDEKIIALAAYVESLH